ncbi:unnamed protein product (macronuclear) [Paramecium tetraurelia]|uniref:Uncharacterized protein n=1 Tax=Paramecium tetraurelia TaxID=5888 RepID=A0C976_PARTE|nr:uncharacterized protein GSPATT00006649001 [Paramecium tetraurelia]CAK67343.1 unnamed protein product [Paramecium tetraurelia]|eukprot:XP_001434740.1 hypothetical protein (macronuclear) [Paramecium tetraurelia strain d4-2]
MKQCLNKLLVLLNLACEAIFQKMIEILYIGDIIRPEIREPVIPTLELQPIDQSIKQPLTLHSSSSTPVFTKNESIYRRAESEKEFRKCNIPNLGDTINKVDSYSRDISLLNLFEDRQDPHQNLNQLDNHNNRNKLQPIIEEHKVFNNLENLECEEINQNPENHQQHIQNQQNNQHSQEQITQDQFYSIIDNPNKITQSEQFFSIIDRSSFRHSFNKNLPKK